MSRPAPIVEHRRPVRVEPVADPEIARIREEQRLFALAMAEAEKPPAPADEEVDARGEPIPVSNGVDPNPPLVQLLDAAVKALLWFHLADDKVAEQMRIASLLRDAAHDAPENLARPLNFIRQQWGMMNHRDAIARYKNKDFANMIRGVELVARVSVIL